MLRLCAVFAVLCSSILSIAQQNTPPLLAPTPPMGWNSWDSFGTTVTEKDIRAAADAMHTKLQPFGWNTITVDMEWSTQNPTPEGNGKDQKYTLDAYGRYTPAPNRFPSAANGAGFGPLAEYVHSLGLKFGIHILQGIPREAVAKNMPVEGTAFRATEAANQAATCGWNPDNFDLNESPAAQAYYDSIARLYARWKVDLVKVDCITQPRYKSSELKMLHNALRKADYPIALSLSPGEPPIEFANELADNAEQWRISNDVWDIWRGTAAYPQGVADQFARTAYWIRTQRAGHWPDADMIPLGSLRPTPGWGKPRETRLSHDEQRTLLTLWSIARSPLLFGGNLTELDDWTLSLLTNREVIAVDQHSSGNHPVLTRRDAIVWSAKPENGDGTVLAVFNPLDSAQTLHLSWAELELNEGEYTTHDLWTHADGKGAGRDLTVTLPPHACAMLLARRWNGAKHTR